MKLVIGRQWNFLPNEVFVDANRSPKLLREFTKSLIERPIGGTDVIVTFSPVVIDTFIEAHKSEQGYDYGNVFIVKGKKEVCVNKLKDPAWLAHFSLAELYMDEEI